MKPIRQQKAIVSAGLVGLLLLAASCGGGGSGGPPTITGITHLGLENAGCVNGTAYGPPPGSSGTDPLLQYQWHLVSPGSYKFSDTPPGAGSDIFPTGIPTRTGLDVKIAVVDTGMEIGHEDLVSNVVPLCSFNFLNGLPFPFNSSNTGDHGTSVAGLAAMRGDNAIGGRGVAPEALLVGYNFIQAQSTTNQVVALGGISWSQDVDVFNQSYGIPTQDDLKINPTVEAQLKFGVENLRGTKGALYVKSAGNGFNGSPFPACNSVPELSCENANFDPSNTVPWQIIVSATNANSVRSSYSTAGSAIWVSAPGGEFGYSTALGWSPPPANPAELFQPAMVTTDQFGCSAGYSRSGLSPAPPNDFEDGHPDNDVCNYTSTFNGTSSAAPVISGVIALMLEANPNLTWRDVKHILATTADNSLAATGTPTSLTLTGGPYVAEPGWTTNASGLTNPVTSGAVRFHNWFGFGRVNANQAVAIAATYLPDPWGALQNTVWISGGTIDDSGIDDNSVAGASDTVTVTAPFTVIEAVQISVSITHPYIGVLGIELISPNGSPNTRSILLNARNGFNTPDLSGMVLLSNAFYGEAPNGTWTIKVVDVDAIPDNGTLDSWSIRIYGH